MENSEKKYDKLTFLYMRIFIFTIICNQGFLQGYSKGIVGV